MKNTEQNLALAFFTENEKVKKEIDHKLLPFIADQKASNPNFGYSDVRDSAGHSYVDLVQEGGGVLGIALVGYTYALEKAGVRFLKMAGTSAGAINTILLAAADKPANPKSEKILKSIAEIDILEFVDGDGDAKDFFKAMMAKKGKTTMIWKGLQVRDNLQEDLGLNPGEVFYSWLTQELENYGISTVNDLRARMEDLPAEIKELVYPSDQAEERKDDWPFALVGADITTESKAIFPKHGPIYFSTPEEVNPAYYVRASMSVPIFFHPLHRDAERFKQEREKRNRDRNEGGFFKSAPGGPAEDPTFLEQAMPDQHAFWKTDLHYKGETPEKVMFVDGGILSNFPIDIFHAWDRVPRRPTFGVKLGLSRTKHNKVDEMSAFGLIGAAFNAARNMRDQEYIFNNPELNQLVTQIDTGDHSWLNFALSQEEKLNLFYRGVQAGVEFLTNFDWEAYKKGRRTQLVTLVDRLSHDLSLLEKAEEERARPKTTSRGLGDDSYTYTPAPETSMAQQALRERLSTIKVQCEKFRILWVCDDYETGSKDYVHRSAEIAFIESICPAYEVIKVETSEQAKQLVLDTSDSFDLIISDISRENNPSEGIDFLSGLVSDIGAASVPPTIFYISDFDPGKGTPPYAFGITNSPTELMHLVIDVMQRSEYRAAN